MSRLISHLQQMTLFITMVTGSSCAMMYYLMQKNFAKSEYYRLALEELNNNSTAMASLGAPPLKIHNIHLSDRHNRMDHSSAQIKIPVTGSRTGGYLYTTSTRDTLINRWRLHQVFLKLRDGETIEIFNKTESKE
ncbi:cytochrome c oxidase assembly factor 1 homolog [Myxocyprinus asiaticus]|uniref:cytochrome c oxidase assembly factor 1 homolog n=1 Tax=Myxocyprinus asiaticus TaxID=70543 RepID=UPI0022215E99|nr:cytochrome c oxidase assembly factor 1 homolog [Myxocyprinus asiaticus]XP_051557731.1 cytochrome c oxidase assembly factor 1 homolog [Myxocyprinus asiaticus]XP_051557732.1 cytochrome c oxidase assembly factor 1 homolog [Myxocyprinus asiaticus]XP_051557733.1 cytochrome c oxidase assembly factor 1 homolog [Myxocyprinus asiaticus]XP_051557734.1 cytochrome c oxidase assembly factor 1 homolog [Myxocyprinus asiaticus]